MRTERRQSQKVQRYAKSSCPPQGVVEDHDAWFMLDEEGDMVQVMYGQKGGKVPDHDVAIHHVGSSVVRYLTWFVVLACVAACAFLYLPTVL